MRTLGNNASRGALTLLLVLVLAIPAAAQLEMDRPTPPGEPKPLNAFTRLDGAGTSADHPGSDHLIVLEHSINRVMDTGVTYVDKYTLYKVLTDDGALDLASLRWDYDPQSSFVEVREVNILREGERISVPVEDVLDMPAPQRAIYWSNRIKLLQMPRLMVGDGIEVKAMRKGYNYALLADGDGAGAMAGAHKTIAAEGDDRYIPPMPGHYFDIVLFRAAVPIIEKKYELTLPKGKRLVSKIYNGPLYASTDYTADSTLYAWWTYDQPAKASEMRAPDASDFVPKVVMTTAESWEQKSEWFWGVNQKQFEVTPEVQEKVDEILRETGTMNASPMEKAKALNHWVAQNIRYSGQTMGEGEGFTLHPSDMLIENRSGVCKDIASMAITFLRAADLKAWPAMTMAGSRIEDLPADQFNHCVVAWEREPGEFTMLDPTWVPYNNDIWSKLETEQQYVIGHPEGVDLQEIRYSPPEESPMRIEHEAELSEDGTLEGSIRLDGTGASDSRLRRVVYHNTKRELPRVLAGFMANVSDRVVISNVEHRVVDDFEGDMWLSFDYTIPQYAVKVGDGFEFKPVAVNLARGNSLIFRAGSYEWADEREVDVFLYYTQRLQIEEEIELPGGYDLVKPPKMEPVDETFAAFQADVRQQGDELILETRTDVRRRQIPPDGYAGYKKALDELNSWGETVLRVAKGGA